MLSYIALALVALLAAPAFAQYPSFNMSSTSYSFTINEGSGIGRYVGTTLATDPSAQTVTYDIASGSGAAYFQVSLKLSFAVHVVDIVFTICCLHNTTPLTFTHFCSTFCHSHTHAHTDRSSHRCYYHAARS